MTVRELKRALPTVAHRAEAPERWKGLLDELAWSLTKAQRFILQALRSDESFVILAPDFSGSTSAIILGLLRRVAESEGAPNRVLLTRSALVPCLQNKRRRFSDRLGLSPDSVQIRPWTALGDIEGADELFIDAVSAEELYRNAAALSALAESGSRVGLVTSAHGEPNELAAALFAEGFWADAHEYRTLRVRSWCPTRNEPWPPSDELESALRAELDRIRETGSLIVVGEGESEPAPACADEVAWVGSPGVIAPIARMGFRTGGIETSEPLALIASRSSAEQVPGMLIKHLIGRGIVESVGDLDQLSRDTAGSVSPWELSERVAFELSAFEHELCERIRRDDEHLERASFWIVSHYLINRGNAKAIAEFYRRWNTLSPLPSGGPCAGEVQDGQLRIRTLAGLRGNSELADWLKGLGHPIAGRDRSWLYLKLEEGAHASALISRLSEHSPPTHMLRRARSAWGRWIATARDGVATMPSNWRSLR